MQMRLKPIDQAFYREHLGFLPSRMIDVHSHVWLRASRVRSGGAPRGPTWPGRVADENAVEDLLKSYLLFFPAQSVTPLVFGPATRAFDLDASNRYVSHAASDYGLPSLLVTTPEWTAQHLEQQVAEGGFVGLKPYLEFAPSEIPSDSITVFDFLPHHHLEVADHHGWIVMLHIPRRERLRDSLNLAQVLEIDKRYPGIRLVLAHIGRAYCPEDVGEAFAILKDTRVCFDLSANTNAGVMEQLLRAVGPKRVLFGSDQPVVRMRMRRICENGFYVNLVPPGLYGDVSEDPHMREVTDREGETLTFFMYEELLAFRRAATALGLGPGEIADIMYENAATLLGEAGWRPQDSAQL
jgi:predicted TIM-barrel fold metal-dependent hydrolase